jgi:hypothetical protein
VPAAAVIPAPIAYIKVVAVKKLVVGFVVCPVGPWTLSVWLYGSAFYGIVGFVALSCRIVGAHLLL